MSGQGMAADSSGNIYVPTGNGTFDTTNVPATELGDTILKMAGSNLALLDYFTPYNQINLDLSDGDVASGGVLLLPDQARSYLHLLVQAGKQGTIYLMNRDQMTQAKPALLLGLHVGHSNCAGTAERGRAGCGQSPVYWNEHVYFWGQ